MQNVIFLRDVLLQMSNRDASGDPIKFNITVREFNSQNKSGGSLKEYKSASLAMNNSTKSEIDKLKYKNEIVDHVSKNPNHFHNRTRNLKLQDGSIRKINILLIIEFNSFKVVY